jgi:hypothetical protein
MAVLVLVGLFCVLVGLFCVLVGLFCVLVGLFCVYLDGTQLDGNTTGAPVFLEGAASREMRAVLERNKNSKVSALERSLWKLNVGVSFENLYLEAVACVKRRLCVCVCIGRKLDARCKLIQETRYSQLGLF